MSTKIRNNSGIIAFLLLLVAVVVFFGYTKGLISENAHLSNRLNDAGAQLQSQETVLGALVNLEQEYEKNKDALTPYVDRMREDRVIALLHDSSVRLAIKTISLGSGARNANGMMYGDISTSIQVNSLAALKQYLEYLTQEQRVVIKSFSFPYKTSPTASTDRYNASLTLGVYYVQ